MLARLLQLLPVLYSTIRTYNRYMRPPLRAAEETKNFAKKEFLASYAKSGGKSVTTTYTH